MILVCFLLKLNFIKLYFLLLIKLHECLLRKITYNIVDYFNLDDIKESCRFNTLPFKSCPNPPKGIIKIAY